MMIEYDGYYVDFLLIDILLIGQELISMHHNHSEKTAHKPYG